MKLKNLFGITLIVILVALNFILGYRLISTKRNLDYTLRNSDILKRISSKISFDMYSYNFGNIENQKVYLICFSFINNSKSAVVLRAVQPSCECTVSEWSKNEIKSGYKGFIQVKYHATMNGEFKKNINVYLINQSDPIALTISGNVLE